MTEYLVPPPEPAARVVEESLPPMDAEGVDLRVVPLVGEHPADYIARVRDTPPDSQSPGDIVPNVAWINPPPEVP